MTSLLKTFVCALHPSLFHQKKDLLFRLNWTHIKTFVVSLGIMTTEYAPFHSFHCILPLTFLYSRLCCVILTRRMVRITIAVMRDKSYDILFQVFDWNIIEIFSKLSDSIMVTHLNSYANISGNQMIDFLNVRYINPIQLVLCLWSCQSTHKFSYY